MNKDIQMNNFLILIDKLVLSNHEILDVIKRSLEAGEIVGFSKQKAENIKQAVLNIQELTRLAQELQGHVEEVHYLEENLN